MRTRKFVRLFWVLGLLDGWGWRNFIMKFVRLFRVLGLLDSWGMEEFHHEIILILLHSKLYYKKIHEPYQKKFHYVF